MPLRKIVRQKFAQSLDPLRPDLEHEHPVDDPGAQQERDQTQGQREGQFQRAQQHTGQHAHRERPHS
jgi:hypothetical protein